MAYEYEGKSNISFSIGNKLHFWNVTDDNLREELQEVYVKARAFNEISQVFKKVTIYNTATALEVKEIVDELEDK